MCYYVPLLPLTVRPELVEWFCVFSLCEHYGLHRFTPEITAIAIFLVVQPAVLARLAGVPVFDTNTTRKRHVPIVTVFGWIGCIVAVGWIAIPFGRWGVLMSGGCCQDS